MGDQSFSVLVPMPGIHMVYNALAAAAIGKIYGIDNRGDQKEELKVWSLLTAVSSMIETDKLLIVDDCYNANPMSMKASLDVLKDGSGRKLPFWEIWESLEKMRSSFIRKWEFMRHPAESTNVSV